jgi:hypothetical protein
MDAYRPKMEDNIHNANPFWYWLNRAGHKKTQDGGANILQGLMYGKNSTAKSYSGYSPLDITPQDGMTAAIFPWRQLSASISISRIEKRKNSGKSQAMNLLENKINQAEQSLIEESDRQSFLDGTGNGAQDIFGLGLLVENGSSWLSDVAGINRTNEAWWRNQWIGTVGSFATNGVDKMRTLYNNCSKGNIHPDLGLTTQTVYEAYEKTLVANERFLDTSAGDAGFQNLLFKAMVLMYDTYVPSGSLYMLTSDYLWLVVDSQTDFITTPFQRPVNVDSEVAQILWYGNVTASNCARQGLMDGIS